MKQAYGWKSSLTVADGKEHFRPLENCKKGLAGLGDTVVFQLSLSRMWRLHPKKGVLSNQ